MIIQLFFYNYSTINNKQMDEKYDENILVSIRSQQSSEEEKIQSNDKKQRQISGKKFYEDQQEFEIKQSIRISGNLDANKKPKVQIKKQAKSLSSDSDFNNDTDQIIKNVKNKKIKVEQSGKKQIWKAEQKTINKQKQNALHNQQIKYPEIKYLQQKNVTKKQNDNDINKKKLQQLNNKFNGLNLQQSEQIDINVSMIGDRITKIKNNTHKQKNIKQKQVKNQQRITSQKIQKIQPNPYQSIYLSNGKLQAKKNQVQYKVMDRTMYWAFGGKQLKINFQVLECMVQNFFKKQIMLPLVSESQFKLEHIVLYLQIYTEFLNYFFKQQFIEIFNILKNSTQFGSKAQIGLSVTSPKNNQSANKLPYYEYISKYFKSSNYSKAQFLRNYIIQKNNFMNLFRQILESKEQSFLENQRKNLDHQISVLQLFVSFENSQNYCKQNSKEGIDHKIWKQHSKKLSELRKNWILKLEQQKYDFSFLI